MASIDLATALACVAWFGLMANIYVWGRMVFMPSRNGLLRHFSIAWVGALTALAASIGFWDVFSAFFSYNEWRSLVASLGGPDSINAVRSLLIIVATHSGLLAAHMLIPREDQRKWPWFLSWATYPPSQNAARFRNFLRKQVRKYR
ncbi:MAG: hypothetical protein Unbinned3138contig1000_23 [Prokaryotic dsDNA virus sp.]|nr:MAG: hypothetical protein Unbinned3138contig1000_23 [Prokaryotic dsDNA virus sp.]|tara:strand:- start:5210 stop:5647 length:438 start_codon:yes stop_codon:yes gene_type:complete